MCCDSCKIARLTCVVVFVKWPVVMVLKLSVVTCGVIDVKWHWQVMRLCWSLIQLACQDVKALRQNWAKSPLGSSSTTNTAIEGVWNWS